MAPTRPDPTRPEPTREASVTVSDPTTVDAIAKAPDGRLLLVMTEDRFYTGGDVAAMTEQLRAKLNGYVRLLRSGQLPAMVGAEAASHGVDIGLSCRDQPPRQVQELLRLAGEGLRSEGVGVVFDLVPPPSPESVYDVIGPLLAQAAPAGWQRVDLTASLVGDGLAGSLVATASDGTRTPMGQPQWLVAAITDLKRALWEPDRGTFTTFSAVLTATTLQPEYDFGEPVDGAEGWSAQDWAEELRRFPRTEVPAWWRARLDGSGMR
jgi:hypothetical protein